MPESASAAQLADLDSAFQLTGTGNAIIASHWYRLAVAAGQIERVRAPMTAFLGRVGRMKLITPIYRALAKTESGRAEAQAIFAKLKTGYHPIAQQSVERILAGS